MSVRGENSSPDLPHEARGVVADTSLTDGEPKSLSALMERMVHVHHARLRQLLPRLLQLADRVAAAHGAKDPGLGELREVLAVLKEDLDSHMLKEEWCIFPKISAWEYARTTGQCSCELECSFRNLDVDHRDTCAALARLRTLTHGFRTPPHAPAVYRDLVGGLAELETALLQHVHEENDVLFPRACVAAALLRARAGAGVRGV